MGLEPDDEFVVAQPVSNISAAQQVIMATMPQALALATTEVFPLRTKLHGTSITPAIAGVSRTKPQRLMSVFPLKRDLEFQSWGIGSSRGNCK